MWDQSIRVYLWFLVITLPMDWFGPTGALLREAGAKPAIPLMMSASIVLICEANRRLLSSLPLSSWHVISRFVSIFALGLGGFVLNLICGWSRFGGAKDPLAQFAGQAALFLLTPLMIVVHGDLFRDKRWSDYISHLIPWAAALHLLAFALELSGILQYDRLPLSVFRTGSDVTSMRLAGMFSEPSYFGTMAALYGVPLMLNTSFTFSRTRRLLAFLLFAAALYAGGKTVFPVAFCGLVGYVWYRRTRIFTFRNLFVMLTVAGLSLSVIIARSTLDVQDNLSSAMRFGSTITSLNAAFAGYGISGVGFGQFHFMFLKAFMPTFLLLSSEAVGQMASSAEHRTSTFNLFTRYLVETGIAGLLLFLALIRKLYKVARFDQKAGSLLGLLFLSTSLGFLLTQEPYCYPPLILGAALILGANREYSAYSSTDEML